MDRKEVIKRLLGLTGLVGLIKFSNKSEKKYTRIYLLHCFIAGFNYYKGPGLLNEMKKGDILKLVREPENKYDQCAIAVHFTSHKIGFIPRSENEFLCKVLDGRLVTLETEITNIEPDISSWENVAIAVYVLREDKEQLPQHAKYLTSPGPIEYSEI